VFGTVLDPIRDIINLEQLPPTTNIRSKPHLLNVFFFHNIRDFFWTGDATGV
jgi:hypothetical protein